MDCTTVLDSGWRDLPPNPDPIIDEGAPVYNTKSGVTTPPRQYSGKITCDKYSCSYSSRSVNGVPNGEPSFTGGLFPSDDDLSKAIYDIDKDYVYYMNGKKTACIVNGTATIYSTYSNGEVIKWTIGNVNYFIYSVSVSEISISPEQYAAGYEDEFSGVINAGGNCGGFISGQGLAILNPALR